jgi:prolyl-tRNA synthetase
VIVPIVKDSDHYGIIGEKVAGIIKGLRSKGISVKYDDRDSHKPGWKFAEYELKGVPLRMAIGPRDLENNTIEIARRDSLQKEVVALEGVENKVEALLKDIQQRIYNKALDFRSENTTNVDNYKEFKKVLDTKGGFVLAHWDGSSETEAKIQEETKATIRCIPIDGVKEEGKCIYSGRPSKKRVVFARSY